MKYLKETPLEQLDPSNLEIFRPLSPQLLQDFARNLKQDPHHLFEKLEPNDQFYRDIHSTKEQETSYKAVVKHNVKREIARELMREKYAEQFGRNIKSRL